jgi:hypothetical protein
MSPDIIQSGALGAGFAIALLSALYDVLRAAQFAVVSATERAFGAGPAIGGTAGIVGYLLASGTTL